MKFLTDEYKLNRLHKDENGDNCIGFCLAESFAIGLFIVILIIRLGTNILSINSIIEILTKDLELFTILFLVATFAIIFSYFVAPKMFQRCRIMSPIEIEDDKLTIYCKTPIYVNLSEQYKVNDFVDYIILESTDIVDYDGRKFERIFIYDVYSDYNTLVKYLKDKMNKEGNNYYEYEDI